MKKLVFEWVLVEIAHLSNKTHAPFRTWCPFKVDKNVTKVLQTIKNKKK
jgi:hypothetical protein